MAKLPIVILLFGYCSVFCAKDIYKYKGNVYLPGYDLNEIEREYREQERRVERPCPVYDLLCIRRYLARHSHCKIAEGPVPDPLFKTDNTVYLTSFNLTVTQSEIFLGGLTGTVSEFSINRKSKLTVLKIDFNNVTLKDSKVYFRYHRRGQEPALTTSNLDDELYPSFSITTVFKGVDHLRLADSESVVFFNVLGIRVIGPELGLHPDPTIAPRFANLLAQPLTATLEGFLTFAPFFAGTYIQNVLCDFGLKLN